MTKTTTSVITLPKSHMMSIMAEDHRRRDNLAPPILLEELRDQEERALNLHERKSTKDQLLHTVEVTTTIVMESISNQQSQLMMIS